jgi:hypothetical protein
LADAGRHSVGGEGAVVEPDGFREFLVARSAALVRSAVLLTEVGGNRAGEVAGAHRLVLEGQVNDAVGPGGGFP